MADVIGRRAPPGERPRNAESLLCVANFPANTGYAWDFIEGLYAGVANQLSGQGVRTFVAYPRMDDAPRTLNGSAAQAVRLDARVSDVRCVLATLRFVRKNAVKAIYLADRPSWHPAYLLFRLAGVRQIVVHDHTSGERTPPRGLKRAVKLVTRRAIPGMLADTVIGVSDYVARRKVEVDLVPRSRVRRVWNSLVIPDRDPAAAGKLRREFGLGDQVKVVASVGRASLPKGIEHLLRAFDRLDEQKLGDTVLVYLGDGPDLERLQSIRAGLRRPDRIIFGGYRADARDLIEGADVCVVPSVWHEAFGLSALEPMARGVPVVATRVGGIPEIVVDNKTGLLVPPADEAALADAIASLLQDAAKRRRLGENGRARAAQHFAFEDQIQTLTTLFDFTTRAQR